jgi:hypothetical protein
MNTDQQRAMPWTHHAVNEIIWSTSASVEQHFHLRPPVSFNAP